MEELFPLAWRCLTQENKSPNWEQYPLDLPEWSSLPFLHLLQTQEGGSRSTVLTSPLEEGMNSLPRDRQKQLKVGDTVLGKCHLDSEFSGGLDQTGRAGSG